MCSGVLNHSGCGVPGLPGWPQQVTPAPRCVFAEHRIQIGAPASNPKGRPHSTEHSGQWAAHREQRPGLHSWLWQQ